MKQINWRSELEKWQQKQPPKPLRFRDTSGIFPPEFYKQVMEQIAKNTK